MTYQRLRPPGYSLRLNGDTEQTRQNREAFIQAYSLVGDARQYMNEVALAYRKQLSVDTPRHWVSLQPRMSDVYQKATNGYGKSASDQFNILRKLL